jgi:hypothetical protein
MNAQVPHPAIHAAIGQPLAEQLAVRARPLPAGKNPRRLVVIAGPPRALG